ncbi:hypothetical protein Gotri_003951, partial [Gossypium trilobum]|nr:hypothetical protein [Gossypium trilobum]
YTGIPLLVRNYRTKWWDKFNDEKYDSKYLDNCFKKNLRLCKSAALDQTTTKFLQAKSTASVMLAQAKTKKEYKNSWLKCSAHWILNPKMRNLQHPQSRRWILQMIPLQ